MKQLSGTDDTFFNIDPDWKQHWEGMPEYNQNPIGAYAEVIVRFDTKEDLEDFAKLVDQNITEKTKSIWHPKSIRGKHRGKRYVDDDE